MLFGASSLIDRLARVPHVQHGGQGAGQAGQAPTDADIRLSRFANRTANQDAPQVRSWLLNNEDWYTDLFQKGSHGAPESGGPGIDGAYLFPQDDQFIMPFLNFEQ